MVYINPVEILELSNLNSQEIDSSIIKKAKRRLFAEIDLSDSGLLDYKGHKLTKSDCEKVIEELENSNKIDFYLHLAYNKELNNFLANGDTDGLLKLKHESIYKIPDFVEFISPFYASKIDNTLLKSFQKKEIDVFGAAIKTDLLLHSNDLNRAYKSLGNELQHRIDETDKLTKEIKDNNSKYNDSTISQIVPLIQDRFPKEYLNKLPAYFQSQINKIAASINFLQIQIWNEFTNTEVPFRLLEYILKLNIESVSKPTFEKNYRIVKKKHEEKIEQEKNAPLLKEWARILISIQGKIEEIENNSLNPSTALQEVITLVDFERLNKLPKFANEVRTQIGYSIRSLSIASWNGPNDIKSAIALINLALKIKVEESDLQKFQQDKIELEELQKKYKGVLVCHFCEKNPPEKGYEIQKTIYLETSRSYFPRRVQYSYSEITIPRCRHCYEIHSQGSSKFRMFFFGLIVIGAIIGAITEGQHFIIGAIIGGVIGWIVGTVMEGNQSTKQGIKDCSDSSLANHPLLQERMRNGWTFSQPSA